MSKILVDREPLERISALWPVDMSDGWTPHLREVVAEFSDALVAPTVDVVWLLKDVRDTYKYAIHWEDMRPVMDRIDRALAKLEDKA